MATRDVTIMQGWGVVIAAIFGRVGCVCKLRKNEGGYTPLRHDKFMAKVEKVL